MSGRSLRHPIRGTRFYAKPATGRARRRAPKRQPRIRPRKSVNVASLVGSPEDTPSRPGLRLQVTGLIVLVLFGLLILRLWSLQVIDAKNYVAQVQANQIRVVQVPAPRGDIVDRNNVILAGNVTQEEVVLSRDEAAQHPYVVGKVAALVGKTPQQVNQALTSSQFNPYEPVPVLNNAPLATVQYLDTHPNEFPGVSVEQVSQRTYPQGTATGTPATHVLGYVSSISAAQLKANPKAGYTNSSLVGQSGLEEQYEPYLKGTPGRQALEVNASGQVVGTLNQTAAVQGDTVETNIDLGLQQEAEAALAADIANDRRTPDKEDGNVYPKATSGALIVMNPNNGQVLAMASSPTYDLNDWVGGISQANYDSLKSSMALQNNAISGEYTPGSTFKMISAVAGLDDGLITPNTSVDDTGTYTVPDCTEGCKFTDDGGESYGETNLEKALTVSDDYYFYSLGNQFYYQRNNPAIGPEGIQNVAKQFGLDSYTGIDLPEEAVGHVDSPSIDLKEYQQDPKAYPYGNNWTTGDDINMAFGQGGTVLTPIQMANAYATFANGGTRYQPQVASAIVTAKGQLVKKFVPVKTGTVNIPTSSVYAPILAGLEGVIGNSSGTAYKTFEGTAPNFDQSNFLLAGKTGTAQVAKPAEPTSWFVAFGPNPNPQYVVLCVVDQGGYGALAAAPAVKQVFQYLQTNPVTAAAVTPSATAQPTTTPQATNPPAGTAPPTTTTTAPGG